MRTLGPWNYLFISHRYLVYIRGKTKEYKELGPVKSLYKRVLLYQSSYYKVPLYLTYTAQFPWGKALTMFDCNFIMCHSSLFFLSEIILQHSVMCLKRTSNSIVQLWGISIYSITDNVVQSTLPRSNLHIVITSLWHEGCIRPLTGFMAECCIKVQWQWKLPVWLIRHSALYLQ